MKNGMKQTEIGEIPVEWEVVKAGEVFINVSDKNHPEEELLSVTQDNGVVLRSEQERRVVMPDGSTAGYKLVKKGDFIISLRSFQGGLEYSSYQGLVSPAYTVLRGTTKMDDAFLTFLFKEKNFIDRLSSSVVGIRDGKQINFRDFKHVYIQLPPLPEQRKIAEILSTLDEKMAVIDEQLAQTQELKKGLMQRLLTKGTGHTQFKESPLGEIPASWEVRLLDDVTKRGSGHTPSKNFPEYYDGGIKWISLADSNKLDNGWIRETKTNISSLGIKNSSATLHPKGTVLLSRDAGIGKSAVMYEDMAVSQHFITWTCNGKINNWFLYYYLQLNKPLFERIAAGSTIKTIGLPFFKKFSILVPTPFEQEKIAEILTTVDEKIGVLQAKKAQYHTLKKGLMQQLLTGQRRVRVAASAETAVLV